MAGSLVAGHNPPLLLQQCSCCQHNSIKKYSLQDIWDWRPLRELYSGPYQEDFNQYSVLLFFWLLLWPWSRKALPTYLVHAELGHLSLQDCENLFLLYDTQSVAFLQYFVYKTKEHMVRESSSGRWSSKPDRSSSGSVWPTLCGSLFSLWPGGRSISSAQAIPVNSPSQQEDLGIGTLPCVLYFWIPST